MHEVEDVIGRIEEINEDKKHQLSELFISNGKGIGFGVFTPFLWPKYRQLGIFKDSSTSYFKEGDFVTVSIENDKIVQVETGTVQKSELRN